MAALRIFNGFRKLSLNYHSQNMKLLNGYCNQKFLSSESIETAKKKRTVPVPKITLIFSDESIQVVTMEEAKKISDRRNLKLVKIVDLDTKTQRPVFKLMTGHEYLAADLVQREKRKAEKKSDGGLKGEKLLLLNSRISEHDLESRIKKISQWLTKRYEVRIVISGDSTNMELCESVYSYIEEKLKTNCRIVQKRTKGNELKFQILPLKITIDNTTNEKITNPPL